MLPIDTLAFWATDLSAGVMVALAALLIYGFRRYIRRPRTEAIDFIGTGIWIMAFVFAVRTMWWDVLPDLLGFKWSMYGVTGSRVNWVFNTGFGLGIWFKLHGYFLLVDQRAPGQYSTLTAPLYPRRLRLWLITRAEEDE